MLILFKKPQKDNSVQSTKVTGMHMATFKHTQTQAHTDTQTSGGEAVPSFALAKPRGHFLQITLTAWKWCLG